MTAKEQARKYAISQRCKFVILSNGNIHYLWNIEHGNPYRISKFPSPDSIEGYVYKKPNPDELIKEIVNEDYVALTQKAGYYKEAGWVNEDERPSFIKSNKLKFLRPYQLNAVKSIQNAVKNNKDRFLFEMATGTGKTLVAAAIIKLFLRTGNANRVLFLVDRLELETQAEKAFNENLSNDYKTMIYKEHRDEWRKAEIVVTTVQSLLFNNKYEQLFSPTDFDLVISDEAHRSIGGNARAVFEYFVGYKLGLTATPKDYLKKVNKDSLKDPREYERRLLLDTYNTFGCSSGEPTFRYSLIDGVRDGYLINPYVLDARTEVTTELLSEEGYAIILENEDDEEYEQSFFQKDFEKKFFSEETNRVFCQTFLQRALRDPISGEIGKSIVFAVSQNHVAKLTQILNKMADELFPGKYKSDFAMQVTSRIPDAQQMTINFSDKSNNLSGSANFIETYKTSKTRVCVTVGMMTTGYDCTDLFNICLMRPIFSPTDFIQIKGRGTRKHNFLSQLFDNDIAEFINNPEKSRFILFDFFANCEYFEDKYDYDEVLKLPLKQKQYKPEDDNIYTEPPPDSSFQFIDPDAIKTIKETQIGFEGMKIDRMYFQNFTDKITADEIINKMMNDGHINHAIDYINENYIDKPEEYFTLDKLRKAHNVDRKLPCVNYSNLFMAIFPDLNPKMNCSRMSSKSLY